MVVTESVTLPKDAVLHRSIRIAAHGVVVDGNGATLVGPAKPGAPTTGEGFGIFSDGFGDVTLRNIRVHGFEIGLRVRNGSGWRIEGCDFSGNHHDPEFGWGDGKRVGGMVFDRLSRSTIRRTQARHNWNGLDLRECDGNRIEDNDFSHCSNTCLRLWNSSGNHVEHNDLSYGLRIRKGEVHARDSAGVLIESGSNDNCFRGNDVTHGGDGIFLRVLNNWVSTGNVFEENDCSHANNNGFESWSPGNRFLRNKANHCSYGFWLGGSDDTVLIGNEACWNGLATGFHNAPEPDFGHGGIVIVNGSGSHTLIDGNRCVGNNGGGIVFRGDLATRGSKWRMQHLVVQRNDIRRHRWGVFARFVDGLDLSSNHYDGNEQDELLEDVANLHRHGAAPAEARRPEARIVGRSRVVAGQRVRIGSRGSRVWGGSNIGFRWDVAGKTYRTSEVEHVFARPGFHRVSLTVSDGRLAAPAHLDVYATGPDEEPATEGGAARWRVVGPDFDSRLVDDRAGVAGSLCVRARVVVHAAPMRLSLPGAPAFDLSDARRIEFWTRSIHPSNRGFRGPNPTVYLRSKRTAWKYTPVHRGMPRNLLRDFPHSEARHGWSFFSIPVAGGGGWKRTLAHEGSPPPFVSQRLRFTTVQTAIATKTAASLVSTGDRLFCVTDAGHRLFESADGERWQNLGGCGDALRTRLQWINGMLTFTPKLGARGGLLLTVPAQRDREHARGNRQLIVYDLAERRWRWHDTITAMTHGAVVHGRHLFGLAHAVMGNFGGPLCRVDLGVSEPLDDHSVLGGLDGANAGWLSRAAQLASLGGRIYGIKNDWQTPQPSADAGDRLFAFDPDRYRPSKYAGGERWDATQWTAARTPCEDLGPLPFEVGHGASLVALPPVFGGLVGAKGGLFLVAGCSPSNHEGHGPPSDRWAIYDVATGQYTIGRLPAPTGAGTSACRHGDRLVIKRGGVHDRTGDRQVWIVRPLGAEAAARGRATGRVDEPDLEKVRRLEIGLESAGGGFTIWIDGLRFVRER